MNNELIEALALDLGLEPNILKAVIRIEGGKYELKDGKIPILFESYQFYKQLRKQYGKEYADLIAKENQEICKKYWARDYGLKRNQYKRLAKAIAIDEELAHRATSFGAFQIMGFHFKKCGYLSAMEMSDAFHFDAQNEQLKAFALFIEQYRKGKALEALRAKEWAKFAELYNGKGYKKNKYDTKLERAYNALQALRDGVVEL